MPQVCLLFGPSAAGGAYIPAFCDVVVMVDGNASMYLGSPRMAEMVIGEKVTLEEMGGAKMHCSVSGCGDVLVQDRGGGDRVRQALPRATCRRTTQQPAAARRSGARPSVGRKPLDEIIPARREQALRHAAVIEHIVDEGSLLRDQEALRAAR